MMARRLLVLVLALLVGPVLVARGPAAAAVEPPTRLVVVRGGAWLLRNHNNAGGVDHTVNDGLGCDLGFAGPGAIGRIRGGKGLPASLQGRELTRLAIAGKLVALAFDAGANADGAPSILDTLQRTRTPATFFLTGTWADQLLRAERAIQSATRYQPRPMFRFPFGDRDTRTIGIVNRLRYGPIRWTVDPLGLEGHLGRSEHADGPGPGAGQPPTSRSEQTRGEAR